MAVAARVDATARPVSDRREIASFLRTDRRYAAYALGDLDGPNRHRVAWAMAHDASGEPIALAAHHEGLVPQPLFLMGDPDGCGSDCVNVCDHVPDSPSGAIWSAHTPADPSTWRRRSRTGSCVIRPFVGVSGGRTVGTWRHGFAAPRS